MGEIVSLVELELWYQLYLLMWWISLFVGLVGKLNPRRRDPMVGYRVHESHEVLILDEEEPTSYKAGMTSSNFEKWLGAKSEMESMYELG